MPDITPQRSYGCSYGCGNPYDFVVVNVSDGTTEFLCLPCFVQLAAQFVAAMTEPDSEHVRAAIDAMTPFDTVPMTGSQPRKRGKNAPATTDDDDLISAFDSVITADELPEEFR